MISLLDANVLMALAWPQHEAHAPVLDWFVRDSHHGWATTPMTQSAFVRLSSNPKLTRTSASSPEKALAILQRLVDLPHHSFWIDDIAFSNSPLVEPGRIQGYRQVPDAHLLAIALQHGGRLATLDRGIRNLVPTPYRWQEVIYLVEA